MTDGVLQDARDAARHLRRSPGFALAAILILALGIGANTAMFSTLNAVVLRQLPVAAPSELVWARGYSPQGEARLTLITALDLLRDDSDGPLTGYCALNGGAIFPVEANGTPTQAVVDFMTAGCLDTLGVAPVVGRLYTAEEAPLTGRGAPVAVIRHRFWQQMFGGNPDVLGQRLHIEGVEVQILGVLPPDFEGLYVDSGADIFAPFGTFTRLPAGRVPGAAYIIGRLRPGATIEGVRTHLSTRWATIIEAVLPPTLASRERDLLRNVEVRVESMATGISSLRDRYLRSVQICFGLTAVLLLLICANLGGLLLARLTARDGEMAVRRALGATRWRLSRQLLSESALLAVAGTVIGIPLAWLLIDVIDALLPSGLVGRSLTLTPDMRVLTVTIIASAVTAASISLIPVLAATATARRPLAQWDRTLAGGRALRNKALIVTQVALCSMLVVGATLLSRSLAALQRAETGVITHNVLSVRLMPVPSGYENFDAGSYYPALLDRIAALPTVRNVGYARMFPNLTIANPQLAPASIVGEPDRQVGAQLDVASPRYFDTVGIGLVRGRVFNDGDHPRARSVAIVNEALAGRLAPGGEIIGRRLSYGTERERQDLEVVGVVTNATLGSLRAVAMPIVYLSAVQAGRFGYYPTLQIATHGDPIRVAGDVEEIVRGMGHEYAHMTLPLADLLAHSTASEQLAVVVANATAVLGVVLASIGLYALLTYSVVRRTREFGVRVAMGATPASILALIMRDGITLTAIGVAIGVPLSIWPAQLLGSLLYGLTPADPRTLFGTALFFVALGLAAGALPALRASRVDPMTALGSE